MFNKKKTEDGSSIPEAASPKNGTETTSTTNRVKPLTSPAAAAPYQGKSAFPLGADTVQQDKPEKGSRLHVGKDIHLKGEITACDRLIVEGKVEASMNSSEIEISESGIFIGEVIIDTADISGKFEGSLTASTKLIVRKSGCVSGDIQYGEIEIEPGGEVSGQLSKTGTKQSELALADKVIKNKVTDSAARASAHH